MRDARHRHVSRTDRFASNRDVFPAISAKMLTDHAGYARAICCVLLAAAMIATMIFAVPAMAQTFEGFIPVTDDAIASSEFRLTLTVRDDDGAEQTKTYTKTDLESNATIDNVVPNSSMNFYVNVHLKDDNVVTLGGVKQLKWQYNIPLPADIVSDTFDEPQTVMDGNLKVADITLVRTDDGKCALKIEYDPTYAADRDHDYYFGINIHSSYNEEIINNTGGSNWTFPGTNVTIHVNRTGGKITGSKNCSWDGRSEREMSCRIQLDADDDIDNFRFWDIAGNDLTIGQPITVRYLYNGDSDNGNQSAVELGEHLRSGLPDATPDWSMTLAKGTYEITYPATINDNAQVNTNNGNKYEHAINTAHYSWTVPDGDSTKTETGSAEYIPTKRTWNFNWIDKNGWIEDSSTWYADSDPKREIKWVLQVNNGSDRGNLAGHTITDTIGAGHSFQEGSLAVRVFDEQQQEISGETLNLTVSGNTISYTFPTDVDNYRKYEIIYYTTVDSSTADTTTQYTNTFRDCERGQAVDSCRTRDKTVDRPSPPSTDPDVPDPQPNEHVNKQVITKSADSPHQIAGTEIYEVPWTLEYTPPEEGEIRELHLYEDWVTSVSDGNTLHMWYSRDYLNLRVQVYNPRNDASCSEDQAQCWSTIPSNQLFIAAADKRVGRTDQGYPEEYYDIRESYYEYPRTLGRSLPKSIAYPDGYFHENAERNGDDNYPTHDGAPAFTFSYLNTQITDSHGNLLFDKDKPFTHKMRITYNTLCDGTPDQYRNYAKYSYKYRDTNGSEQEGREEQSAYITIAGEGLGGKLVDPENDGKTWWNNEATCSDTGDDAGYCTVHWRVWGNGKKSWWAVNYHEDSQGNVIFYEELEGLSGVYSLGTTLTMTDTLPNGWEIDPTKPIFGRFVSAAPYATAEELQEAGLDPSLKGWLPLTEAQGSSNIGDLPQQSYTFKIVKEGDATNPCPEGAVCATYTQTDNGIAIFTVPNNGTLTAWKTQKTGTANPQTGSGPDVYYAPTQDQEDTIDPQTHAIIVYEFNTRIKKTELERQGMVEGSRFTYTNTAHIDIGDGQTFDVSGDTFVKQGEELSLNKWVDGTTNNQIKYVVELNLQDRDLTNVDVLTLKDTLYSPNASYLPGSFILSTNSGAHDIVKYPEDTAGFTAIIGQDDHNRPTATFAIPIKGMYADSVGNSTDQPLYKNKALRINYTVQIRGVPGQSIDVRNTVQYTGQLTGNASNNRLIRVVTSTADAGASGAIVL